MTGREVTEGNGRSEGGSQGKYERWWGSGKVWELKRRVSAVRCEGGFRPTVSTGAVDGIDSSGGAMV